MQLFRVDQLQCWQADQVLTVSRSIEVPFHFLKSSIKETSAKKNQICRWHKPVRQRVD